MQPKLGVSKMMASSSMSAMRRCFGLSRITSARERNQSARAWYAVVQKSRQMAGGRCDVNACCVSRISVKFSAELSDRMSVNRLE
jgi:hypothetical protein